MSGFVDIHTHILPGVDDGAKTLQEACQLVRMARQAGTRTFFLTPHCWEDRWPYSPQRVQEAFSQLQEQVAQEMPDVQLYLGAEIRYSSSVPERLQQEKLLSMGGSDFVLLEFSTQAMKSQILMAVTEMVRYGFAPIIAHAERCECFHTVPNLVDEVRSLGGYIQVNADSIMGTHGFSVKRFSRKLLKDRKVDFVASDAHNSKERPPVLNKCFMWVSKKCGEEYAVRVFIRNANCIARKES